MQNGACMDLYFLIVLCVQATSKRFVDPCTNCVDEECICSTRIERVQQVCTYSLCIVEGRTNKLLGTWTESASDGGAARLFVEKILSLEEELLKLSNQYPLPPDLTDKEVAFHKRTGCCHICEKLFLPSDTQVRDHCHWSGEMMGRRSHPSRV